MGGGESEGGGEDEGGGEEGEGGDQADGQGKGWRRLVTDSCRVLSARGPYWVVRGSPIYLSVPQLGNASAWLRRRRRARLAALGGSARPG